MRNLVTWLLAPRTRLTCISLLYAFLISPMLGIKLASHLRLGFP